MWILKWLGLGKDERAQAMPESETFGKVLRVLDGIDAHNHDEAQYLAAFACLLGRVAYADGFISEVEQDYMKRMLGRHSSLSFTQVALVLDIAKLETITSKGADDLAVSSLFAQLSTRAQHRELLDCLFAVAAADEIIHDSEWASVMSIADEVGIDGDVFAEISANYTQYMK